MLCIHAVSDELIFILSKIITKIRHFCLVWSCLFWQMLSGWSFVMRSSYWSHVGRDQVADCSWAWKGNYGECSASRWHCAS